MHSTTCRGAFPSAAPPRVCVWWGTVLLGATAATLALRLQRARAPEVEWDGAPVVVGRAPTWRDRLP